MRDGDDFDDDFDDSDFDDVFGDDEFDDDDDDDLLMMILTRMSWSGMNCQDQLFPSCLK